MFLVKDLFLDFGSFQISIERMEMSDQGVTGLSGPSGSGKTTFMRVLLGLEPQARYQWIFKGEDLSLLPPSKRNLAFVFQQDNLFGHLSVKDNILFPALSRKIKPEESRLSYLIESLKVEELLKKKAFLLSGGERQRVAIARALLLKPRFLFLDEPFSALDEETKNDVKNMVSHIIKSEKTPTLFITHSKDDRESLCDSVFFLNKGKLT